MTDITMARGELAFFRSALNTFVQTANKFQLVCTTLDRHVAPVLAPVHPSSPVQQLIVLDSSFNPPTVAHMQMAMSAIEHVQKCQEQRMRCRLLLLLSVNNADKAPKPASFDQRLAFMLAMARDMHTVDGGLGCTSSLPIDIGLTSQPYFHDKSSAIAASDFYAHKKLETPQQIFLVGYDTLIRIFDAKYYMIAEPPFTPLQTALTPFLRRAHLRVTTRPDDQWNNEDHQKSWLSNIAHLGGNEDWTARVEMVSGPYKGKEIVSSTMAREAAKSQDWQRLAALVSPSVLSWIKTENVYE